MFYLSIAQSTVICYGNTAVDNWTFYTQMVCMKFSGVMIPSFCKVPISSQVQSFQSLYVQKRCHIYADLYVVGSCIHFEFCTRYIYVQSASGWIDINSTGLDVHVMLGSYQNTACMCMRIQHAVSSFEESSKFFVVEWLSGQYWTTCTSVFSSLSIMAELHGFASKPCCDCGKNL